MATIIDDKHEKYWLSLRFCEAIRTKYPRPMPELTAMLDEGLPVDSIVVNKESLLSLAAYWGNTALAQELIKRGAPVSTQNIHGDTPLNYAIKQGHREIAGMLIEANADAFRECAYTKKDVINLVREHGWPDIEEKILALRDTQMPALMSAATELKTGIKPMQRLKLKKAP